MRWKSSEPEVFSGDEPHYLIIISSMLLDGDIDLRNNYRDVSLGHANAGRRFKGSRLDHHTLIQDLRTGESRLWEQVFDMSKPLGRASTNPAYVGFKRINTQFPDYTPINTDYKELPKHPVPYPGTLALILELFGSTMDKLEARAIYAQIFLSWLTGIFTYLCALKIGLGSRGALSVTALLYFASPWLVYSHQLFPATFMGLLLLVALWALLDNLFLISALFLAVAAMQSEAFVLIFPAWIFLLFLCKKRREAGFFAAASVISIALTSLFNHLLLGHASIRDTGFGFDLTRVWRTFLEAETGVLLFLPWSLAAFCFLLLAFLHRNPNAPEQQMLLKMVAGGILPVAAVYMILPYTGQFCYGPRYWVPYVPWLALAFGIGVKQVPGASFQRWFAYF